RIEAVLARTERLVQDAAFPFGYALAVAEVDARRVRASPAVVADHHAHIADWHHRLGNDLDRGEPTVDEVGAVCQRNVLAPAMSPSEEERLRVLVVVVE